MAMNAEIIACEAKTVVHASAYPSQALKLQGSGSACATSISAWPQPVGMTSLNPDINVDTHVHHTSIHQSISTHNPHQLPNAFN
jgi:hypothetical protein